MEDRLTSLPESLQLRILSTLDAKYVVQTSILSKSWFPLWKSVPILRLNSYDFENRFSKFDKFVEKALSSQHEMDLDYFWVDGVKGRPLSRSFTNLTDLYLKLAVITEQDLFSGFPKLNKLTLVRCQLNTNSKTLKVHAKQLSELSILPYEKDIDCIELITPKLKLFEYKGFRFPKLKTCDGLPNLDSVVVAFAGCSKRYDEKRMFDDLMMFFSKVYSVKSLKVCKGIVRILSMFQEELVSRCPPFRDFKFDVGDFDRRPSESIMRTTEYLEFISDMKGYLLRVTHCER
ncbi:F-box/LRR-repeat protein-like protein [Tanacetum coccineum]